MKHKKKLTAEELDALHDAGGDLSAHLDVASSRRPGREIQRVNVDFPRWMIASLDEEADRLGVPRQSVIKVWISERLERMQAPFGGLGAGAGRAVNEDPPAGRRL
jgi:hypothetical protein